MRSLSCRDAAPRARIFRAQASLLGPTLPDAACSGGAVRSNALGMIVLGLLLAPVEARADWLTAPDVNVPITTAIGTQRLPSSTPDGLGGVIIAWWDMRDSAQTGVDVYAQRIDARGVALWSANGTRVAGGAGDQETGPIDN